MWSPKVRGEGRGGVGKGGEERRESRDKLTGEAPLRQPAVVPGRVLGRAVSTR